MRKAIAEIPGSNAKGVVFLSGEFWDEGLQEFCMKSVLVLFLRMGLIFRSHGGIGFVDAFEISLFIIFFFWCFVLFC